MLKKYEKELCNIWSFGKSVKKIIEITGLNVLHVGELSLSDNNRHTIYLIIY